MNGRTAHPAPMSVARLEWLRLWRTNRLAALLLLFAIFGLLGPVTAVYLPEIIGLASEQEGFEVTIPDPTPPDGIAQYVGNVSQLGLVAVAAVAAMALAVDARPGLAAFYRTRQSGAASWLLPRWLATTLAAVVGWTVGLLAATYETVVLIGALPLDLVLAGWACWAVYLAFVVAVVALAAGVVRSTVGVTAVAVVGLLAVGAVGAIPPLGRWLPSSLVGAPTGLVQGGLDPGDLLKPGLVTVALTVVALVGAVLLARGREL
jgi:ABC-2 type transport system permease protein